jgi:hypothetical protein
MLTLLIPFIALSATVQAQRGSETPCIVEFIGKDMNKDYHWNKVFDETPEENLTAADKEAGIVGRISLPSTDILAGFSWQNGSQVSAKRSWIYSCLQPLTDNSVLSRLRRAN